jgi:classical protein kinase C
MASNLDDTIANVREKLEKERLIINSANAMRQSTNNPDVISRLDSQLRDSRRNIEYFENTLQDLEMKRIGSGVDNISLQPGSRKAGNPLTPPPKDGWNGYMGQDQGNYGDSQAGYSNLSGGTGLMPQSGPFTPIAPTAQSKRPNYSKLGMALPTTTSYAFSNLETRSAKI